MFRSSTSIHADTHHTNPHAHLYSYANGDRHTGANRHPDRDIHANADVDTHTTSADAGVHD